MGLWFWRRRGLASLLIILSLLLTLEVGASWTPLVPEVCPDYQQWPACGDAEHRGIWYCRDN
ncbi:MAG: hypothetical protein FJX76_16215 [Armatimonadetes bacterium]|nr:hypothetical protein [Armatimonadota bacterium]